MNAIADKARQYLGTPWMHQGRVPGHGLDCVGLVVMVGRALGLNGNFDLQGYSRVPDGVKLMFHLRKNLVEIPKEDMQPGDIVCVSFDKHPQHVGIVANYVHGGLSIIHASASAGKVVEHRLIFGQSMKFVSAFRVKWDN